jgi:hypothetical protein
MFVAFSSHGRRICTRERRWSIRLHLRLRSNSTEFTRLLARAGDLLTQPRRLRTETRWTGSARSFNRVEVSVNAFLNLLPTLVDLAHRVVPVTAAHNLELVTAHGNYVPGQ